MLLTTFSGVLDSHVVLLSAGVHPQGAEVVVGVAVSAADRSVDCGTLGGAPTRDAPVCTGRARGAVRARRLVTQLCNTFHPLTKID